MGFYTWRLRISLAAARETVAARPAAKADHDGIIARWREAMARESQAGWSMYAEPVPVRVVARRPRR